MNLKKLIGDKGENLIAKQYRRNGYKIIARNFSCRLGELDIVAQKGNTVAVVEVKTRKNDDFAQRHFRLSLYGYFRWLGLGKR